MNPFLLVLLAGFCLFSCQKSKFKVLSSAESGLDFENTIFENDTSNLQIYPHLYYGAGVGVGDFNNDGLEDLFFSGSQVSGRLYLNQGKLTFKDITASASLMSNRWQTGVNVVDINLDGFLDLYVNVSGKSATENQLYINNGDLTFSERAKEYGLADPRQVIQSAFLDYDMDGDLDLFMIVNPDEYLEIDVNRIRPIKSDGSSASTDVLYRNNGDMTFTDVSEEAGISIEGYSLGLAVSDINNDGWPDIYVSNDFLSNDIFYINQQNGSFKDESRSLLGHTSFAGMGVDIADFNNDQFTDIIQMDMRPEDSYRQKMILPPAAINKYYMSLDNGYQLQNTRNSLQLSHNGKTFDEIGFMSGISSTDWSWSALFFDADNDLDKDLYITNGYWRDMGNRDFIDYANQGSVFGSFDAKMDKYINQVHSLSAVSISDYLFENQGELSFKNRSEEWGLGQPSVSHGAAYADFDLDGDLDLVTNNVNGLASLIVNIKGNEKNFLRIKLKGPDKNPQAIGAKVSIVAGNQNQLFEQQPTRGFMSSVSQVIHVGLASEIKADIMVIWPDGKHQSLLNQDVNQTLTINYSTDLKDSKSEANIGDKNWTSNTLLYHQENRYIDFFKQSLKPHMHSRLGPAIAVGDVNGDGLEDWFLGGAAGFPATIGLQNRDGSFIQSSFKYDSISEEVNAAFFDVEQDGDLDLFVVSGDVSASIGNTIYQDRLYLNNGTGSFLPTAPLSKHRESGQALAIADFDKDGDEDIFVGGRVVPGRYPEKPKSYLLRNDSETDDIQFTEVTNQMNPELSEIGMVSDAIWIDYDLDDWLDLVVVGEFMPISVFRNEGGILRNVTKALGLSETKGWWNTISSEDFNQDGKPDFIIGNEGHNNPYFSKDQKPIHIYAKDFDSNGSIDPLLTYHIQGTEQLAFSRDEVTRQINPFRHRFVTHDEFAKRDFASTFRQDELDGAEILTAKILSSIFLASTPEGYQITELPIEAQAAPINSLLIEDFNDDGLPDVLLGGNSNATHVGIGWSDGFSKPLLLVNNGENGFEPHKEVFNLQTRMGFVKHIVPIQTDNLLVAQNDGEFLLIKRLKYEADY